MAPWNLPPKAKVYEAFLALADGRVKVGELEATVASSGGDKVYKVKWSEDQTAFASNDNASVWQGYAGYPIVAVLLALGKFRDKPAAIAQLAGINWSELNKRFKRDYDAAVEHVLKDLHESDRLAIVGEAEAVYAQLATMQLEKLRKR